MTDAVSFRQVSKRFQSAQREVHALSEVSFDIQAGEFFGLLGPTGRARPR